MENNFKVAESLLAGLIAGIAIVILLSKEKGNDIQVLLSESLKNLGNAMKKIVANGIKKLTDLKKDIVKANNDRYKQPITDDLEHA